MDDTKRESRIKRTKTEVKNTVASYLQRRNYLPTQPLEVTTSQHISNALVESGISKSNSILYSCYNSDPPAMDLSFSKFVFWLKEQIKKNRCQDLEQIVGPLFCHLYIDILKGRNADKAVPFYKKHLKSVDKSKCSEEVKELIQLFGSDLDITAEKEIFRSKKIIIELASESLDLLKKFVLENCHLYFLEALQTWFNFHIIKEETMDDTGSNPTSKDPDEDHELKMMLEAIQELETEAKPVYNAKICSTKEPVNCGLLKRQCGLVAFSESNVVRLQPLHDYDSLFECSHTYDQIKLTDHSERVYSLDISPDNSLFVTCSADQTLCIYDFSEMKLINKCFGHVGPVYCVKFSNRNYIASGSQDMTARLWEASTGKTLRVFIGHTQAVTCVAFHPNCLYLVTGSADRNVRMWCINKATCLRLLHAAKGTIHSLMFDPSGKHLVASSDDHKVRFWDLLNSKVSVELKTKDCNIVCLQWSTDGTELCGGSSEGKIYIWNCEALKDNWEQEKNHVPEVVQELDSRLFCIEYSFGTFGTLSTS